MSEHDSEPLSYGTVFARGAQRGVTADSAGYFVLEKLPPGPQILAFSHIGCDEETRRVDLRQDTLLTVYLHHHDNYVETVTVAAKAYSKYGETLDNQATDELADALENLTGVSTLRTGTAAAKPVYDGLYGNRLSVQNNGIAQSGQQWGNDHSPEIDPWIAAYVRVVEGVEALKYAGPTAGATVLIEPAPLRETESLSGKTAFTSQSNGRGQTLNARLSNGGKTAYRLSATGKWQGDQRTPDYFLRNTGRREVNGALQLARFHNERWTSRLYLSSFNAEIGILRGAHIGNLNDLEAAIGRPEPFYTEPDFSGRIANPRQNVSHHLAKAEVVYRPSETHRFRLTYGGQLNDRKEYDVRRGDRNDDPALSLLQFSHLLEGDYHREVGAGQHLEASAQFEYVTNDNQPGTGVLPLIPDYNANRASVYVAYHRELDRFQFHGGLRYDRQFFEAITISRTLPREIQRFEHNYSLFGASTEARWQLSDNFSLRAGATFRERAPQINELYSAGLHQGVSGIEEGDRNLGVERSLKFSVSSLFSTNEFGVNATVFAQPISNYIFLEPQDELRLTIRGAFPLFIYRGSDALLYGLNLQAYYQINDELKVSGALSQVRGEERRSKQPLVYLPPLNFRAGLGYQAAGKLEGWSLHVNLLLVAKQDQVDEEQDFLPPPPAYALLDLEVARQIPLSNYRKLNLRLFVQNALNQTYRDYLDRQRYFADAPGINIGGGVVYSW